VLGTWLGTRIGDWDMLGDDDIEGATLGTLDLDGTDELLGESLGLELGSRDGNRHAVLFLLKFY
jgi:hypothetical protein